MYPIIVLTALGCAAVLIATWLLTRPRTSGPRCHCGAAASLIIDQQWLCAKHGWERMKDEEALSQAERQRSR
jgi:hypothetical protein